MRFLWFWLNFLFSVVAPLFAVHWKYPLFYESGQIKVSGIGIVLAIVVVWGIKDHFQNFVKTLEPSGLKALLTMILNSIFWGLLAMVAIFLQNNLRTIQMLLWMIAIMQFVAGFFKYKHLEIINRIRVSKGMLPK